MNNIGDLENRRHGYLSLRQPESHAHKKDHYYENDGNEGYKYYTDYG
jgi:hypothetical protein